ncbi:Uncharacterised protein [Shewanella morhuae]|uniref:Uncharacterized protein n=1 Tax=Shewanella morhuae TaxID=365591 RepID=A0A380BZI6_9GAMM|nr:Uncharacterised protein [Shewanella morhuae]
MENNFAVNGDLNCLSDILMNVERLAKEFAFNLEFVCISDFFEANHNVYAEVLHYFGMLSYFLNRSSQLNLPSKVVNRVKSSHKFLNDSFVCGRNGNTLLTDNCSVWLGNH